MSDRSIFAHGRLARYHVQVGQTTTGTIPMLHFEQPISRRRLLQSASCGFGYLALAGLCGETQAAAPDNPLAPKPPHHTPKAKRVIFLFMQGGPSHVDTFDYKPRLARDDGKKVPFLVARTRQVTAERVFQSLWKFKQYGQCGRWVSDLFPHIARHVDDLCFIHSMHTEGVAHGPATLYLPVPPTSFGPPSGHGSTTAWAPTTRACPAS
jgi:hypothetical protein